MQTLRRRLSAWKHPREALSRVSFRHLLALFLVVIVPGGLVVPFCYGLYGALRHSLGGKVAASRSADSGIPAVTPETSQR